MSIETIKNLDHELVKIIKNFLLLAKVNWPPEPIENFLKQAKKNNFILPKFHYHKKTDYKPKINELKKYLKKLGHEQEPVISFLRDTATSYLDAYHMLNGLGTSDINFFSKKLYGGPKDIVPEYKRRNIDIARYFMRTVNKYHFHTEEELIYTSKKFQKLIHKHIIKNIDPNTDPIKVNIDKKIAARAAAGPNYLKIRSGVKFSESDLDQLLNHEILIHTLTYLNGRKQPILKSLGYNSPRTTATQEGLATFAEYMTLSIDLVRLKRIALRIIALDLAEKGADLIDLFKFFKNHDQNNEESLYSAMRIFRGGFADGGIIFYKDNVYLRGLIEVESFLKYVLHKGRLVDMNLLFCGKLTTSDVINLHSFAQQGHIKLPVYLPPWAKRSSELATHLAINDLTERFNLTQKS